MPATIGLCLVQSACHNKINKKHSNHITCRTPACSAPTVLSSIQLNSHSLLMWLIILSLVFLLSHSLVFSISTSMASVIVMICVCSVDTCRVCRDSYITLLSSYLLQQQQWCRSRWAEKWQPGSLPHCNFQQLKHSQLLGTAHCQLSTALPAPCNSK